MNLKPEIIQLESKILVGMHQSMSMATNTTPQLWGRFRSSVMEVNHRKSTNFISLQVYPHDYFISFNPAKEFEKWAAVETESASFPPAGMEKLILPGGMYAVFKYKGNSMDARIFQYIYTQWLPASEYQLDHRPHFEVMGSTYAPNDNNAEEDIYIPVRGKIG